MKEGDINEILEATNSSPEDSDDGSLQCHYDTDYDTFSGEESVQSLLLQVLSNVRHVSHHFLQETKPDHRVSDSGVPTIVLSPGQWIRHFHHSLNAFFHLHPLYINAGPSYMTVKFPLTTGALMYCVRCSTA